MIQAECSCGWTMAGPPADSWEIDQAIDEHDVWCPENDWVNDEIEGQQIERDRIIGKIRATFSPECADHIVDVITRNMKNDPGTPAKKFPEAAQDQTTSKEIKPMYKTTTQPTPQRVVTEDANGDYYIDSPAGRGGPYTDRDHAEQIASVLDEVLPSDDEQRSAWHPLWCVDCLNINPDERHHEGATLSYSRPYSIEYGDIHVTARLSLWEFFDMEQRQPTTVQVAFNHGEPRDFHLHDLDQVINVLSQARQQLIEVGED